ncbi:Crp/Fnr family transcriptional regulator [uncultured Thalassospira sp.]|jgi:CRP/FNR family transcriptional regulator|uniref:Crp/Fnr family transcriptional regulator n=1 Tax=uncultured Thalassospira sp. TaxID=404382 RepID=UPI0030D9729B|tara:strand:- start:20652 stop:21359 length:708 start_codon:yes stop_codon:yes gene_type:complete
MRSRPLSETEYDLVATAPLFTALGDDRFRELAGKCRIEHRAAGDHLFRAGDIAANLYFLLSGQLRLVKISAQGDETVMHFLTLPGAFAEAISLAGRAFPVNCEVMEECEIVVVPRDACIALLRSTPRVATDVLIRLIEWERFLLGEIYQLRHAKPLQRIASFLIDFEDRSSEQRPDDNLTAYPEKRLIASRIGVTPETFSRSLRKLEAAGAIAKGPHLKILDRRVLEQAACNTAP